VRLGIACDGGAPAPVLGLLARAGLAVPGPEGLRPPAYVGDGDDGWLLAAADDVLAALLAGRLTAAVLDKETLLERRPRAVELLDLGVGRDRLLFAAPQAPASTRPRLATRLPRLAGRACAARGWQARVVRFGAPALALRLGLADAVLERASALGDGAVATPLAWSQPVAEVSARLVTTGGARALAGEELAALVARLREVLAAEGGEP